MIKDINSFFEGFQQANSLKLVSHHWGDFWNAWSSRLLRYPNITTYSVTKGITNKKVDTYDVTVTISDMVRNDDSNLIDVENSTLQICRDVFDAMRVHFSIVNSSVSIRFFRQSGGDVVAGHTFVVTVQEVGKSNCGADMKLAPCRSIALFVNDVKIGDFINDVNLTLKDTQGNDVDFTVSGNDLVVNDVVCADATVTNGGAYADTVVSGGTLLLPNENITVNGNLLVNKPSVEDYDVEVVDGLNNPIGVVSGGKVVVSGGVKAGIAYREPNISSITNTSYADYDAGWRSQNNAYVNVQPDNPLYYQDLDYNSADPHSTLLHNNIFGNKHRFTNNVGAPVAFTNHIDLYDHLTGRIYFKSSWGTFNWEDSLKVRVVSGCLPSYEELLSLAVGNKGVYNINGTIDSLGSEYNWTCNTDVDNPLNGVYISGSANPTINVRSKSLVARPKFLVRLMHPISNP